MKRWRSFGGGSLEIIGDGIREMGGKEVTKAVELEAFLA